MKTQDSFILLRIVLSSLIGTIIVVLFMNLLPDNKPKVDLPEEYKSITPGDNLQGRYDEKTNTLYIWFNNPESNR